jgi:cytochrome c peroxidase
MLVFTGVALALVFWASYARAQLTDPQTLGQFLYFDRNLSNPAGQACSDCHLPEAGFADPDVLLPVSEGVNPGLFGGRNSPMAAYAMFSPTRFFDAVEGLWIGGLFLDSRADGSVLGDPLADQAIGPFVNPVEMANLDIADVVSDAQDNLEYGALFMTVCNGGVIVDLNDNVAVQNAYNCVGASIAAFERTGTFAPFDSKYDFYLQSCLGLNGLPDECAKGIGAVAQQAGEVVFTALEWQGLQLFMNDVNNNDGIKDPGEGSMCVACHVADWTLEADHALPVVVPAWAPVGMVPPMFTDFTYDNLGLPVNPEIAVLIGAPQPVDVGLGAVVGDVNEDGKFKVSTLRNLDATPPFTHNGFFETIDEVVHFYNTREVPGAGPGGADWPAPEVPATVNNTELGNLGLTVDDEVALSAFIRTLSDGFVPPAPIADDPGGGAVVPAGGGSSSGGGCFILSAE